MISNHYSFLMENEEISNQLGDSRKLRRISLRECILGLFSVHSTVKISKKVERKLSTELLDEDRFLPDISMISGVSEE